MKRSPMSQGRKDSGSLWLTIFSDMTTNLMLFFLMLFAMTRMTAEERRSVTEGMEHALSDRSSKIEAGRERLVKKFKEENAIENLRNIIHFGDLSEYAKMEVDKHRVKITLDMPVFFASGSSKLNKNALNALKGLSGPLKEFPNDIIIEGHTDNVPVVGGVYRSNWELSVGRAVSVINFFVDKGISPRQLVSGGYGEYRPAYPNDTEEHRARNRRIEITIVRRPQG